MAEITPRWEWRSFGRRFGDARDGWRGSRRAAFRRATRSTCFPPRGANVKVRDALMDIKVLREVDADGLEQWTPVMKAGFPLPAAEAAKVLEALGLPIRRPCARATALDEFVGEFAAPGGAIRVVTVHKRRTRYTVGGCMAELSDVVANGTPDPDDRGRVGGCGRGDRARCGSSAWAATRTPAIRAAWRP